jgi:hypothetical protein
MHIPIVIVRYAMEKEEVLSLILSFYPVSVILVAPHIHPNINTSFIRRTKGQKTLKIIISLNINEQSKGM